MGTIPNILDQRALLEELDLFDEYGLLSLKNSPLITVITNLKPYEPRSCFNIMMFQSHKLYKRSIDLKLTKKNNKENVEKLMKEKKNYTPSKFYKDTSHQCSL